MLTIDGSFGEGGGQIVRTSLSLAAVTGQAVAIHNIRAGRDRPGLRPQHVAAALAVAEVCGADLHGAEVGSTSLEFRPRAVRPGDYEFDVARVQASAGSANLILQTVLWPLALAKTPSRVVIRGGTHVPFAPTSEYIRETFLPAVSRMGAVCDCEMTRAGYYPAGGGEMRVHIRPAERLLPLRADRPDETPAVKLTSAVSNLPESIAQRQMSAGVRRMRELGIDADERLARYPSAGKGTVFFISVVGRQSVAGFQSLGEIRKRAEAVAEEACDEFEEYIRIGAALDKRLADQLVIPAALAPGESVLTTCEVTRHLLTNIAVVQKFLSVSFRVGAGLGEPARIEKVRE